MLAFSMALDTPLMCALDTCSHRPMSAGVNKPTTLVAGSITHPSHTMPPSTATEEVWEMNVQTTRLRMEPWAWSPAAMSMHVGHTFVFTHLNLSELATTSSKSNIGYVTLVMNTHTHTSATGPCLTVTLVRTVVHCVCALASLSLSTVQSAVRPLLRSFLLVNQAAS